MAKNFKGKFYVTKVCSLCIAYQDVLSQVHHFTIHIILTELNVQHHQSGSLITLSRMPICFTTL